MTKDEMVQFALKSDDTVENTMWHIYQQGKADAIDEILTQLTEAFFDYDNLNVLYLKSYLKQLKREDSK